MGLSKFLFLLYFFYIGAITSADDCSPMSCGFGSLIRFPFSIDNFRSCGYPGFNMSCKGKMNSISIQIGSWGEFFVQDVDYISQKVRIYDQHNCLPKRLLNIDLSRSPFRGAHYRNFTFYNCSSEFSTNISRPISCLSTRNHTVYASSNRSSEKMFRACDVLASVMVPSLSSNRNDEINKFLPLVWDTPDCRECVIEQAYSECGFKNKYSREIQCFFPLPPPKPGLSRGRKQETALVIGIPVLICFVLMIFCASGRRRPSNVSNLDLTQGPPIPFSSNMQEPTVSCMGLDESVIQSYPKTILGESGRLPKPEDNTCSICLSEYQAKETLKTIPDCKHCFHATCIDEWLRKNITCPICRHSPMPSPLAA
ncbi:hypothetical protein ACHQM5_006015 [Ranunculus cassubicifolius]